MIGHWVYADDSSWKKKLNPQLSTTKLLIKQRKKFVGDMLADNFRNIVGRTVGSFRVGV